MRNKYYAALQSGSARTFVLAALMFPGLLSAQEARGAITGTVGDSSGTPLSGAEVTLSAPGGHSVTDAAGEFRLSGVPVGIIEVRVRRLGFRPESTSISVRSGIETPVNLRLTAVPFRLPTVEVVHRDEPYDSRLAGFNARRKQQVGHFITRDQLDRMSSARFVDAVRDMPGLQLRSLRGGGTTIVLRGSRCPALVFIDGFPADAGTMDLDMIDLSGVEGIEIYSGVATIPSEFMSARETHGCGVVAIWSRPTRARRQKIGDLGEVDLEKLLAAGAVYTSDQVDAPARLSQGTAEPVYPDSLWHAGVGGRVVAEFIVDAKGLIEPGSLRIVSTTHPYFMSAVRAALGSAIFRAAELGGKTVRQIVELPFLFVPAAKDTVPQPPQ
ncbi:MAG TPA: carboxypeptidase regulatory-like domain-containing protein [Gemmatimonadaceae bacterium]|nr:carboxypeptidase regulatory-like domain-containing protein [Gemmatimonadaceae bacterium]